MTASPSRASSELISYPPSDRFKGSHGSAQKVGHQPYWKQGYQPYRCSSWISLSLSLSLYIYSGYPHQLFTHNSMIKITYLQISQCVLSAVSRAFFFLIFIHYPYHSEHRDRHR
ncbi:hypothetical protein BJX61DRAFT_475660 [Aspergillus egyptiacus]|nr:hypothetical protein BJX61DRAFT_475660 [Aspergillus egyptiacus]